MIINKKTYYVSDEKNGPIYEVDEEGECGPIIGKLKDGEPSFY